MVMVPDGSLCSIPEDLLEVAQWLCDELGWPADGPSGVKPPEILRDALAAHLWNTYDPLYRARYDFDSWEDWRDHVRRWDW